MRQVLFILLLFNLGLFAQDFSVETITPLSSEVFETSGLIQIEERLITHNDSGDGPYLYEIDTIDGSIVRTVVIGNATNIDWEDITNDTDYIYVGDFGNNDGNRLDLSIYRILISDYLTTDNDTVFCDTIRFNYSDQVSFEPATFTTNYDAEAFIAMEDSLYLFTKNWGDLNSHIYSIPKIPGEYPVSIVDTLYVEGLVTGATYDTEKVEILLIGYSIFDNFLFLIQDFSGSAFSESLLTKAYPTFEGSRQTEGVAAVGNHNYYVSSEKDGENLSLLHLVSISNFAELPVYNSLQISIYPNPTRAIINIEGEYTSLEIVDIQGNKCFESTLNSIDLSHLPKGVYVLRIRTIENNSISKKIILN
ncbi:T9SS type A sorting domain-containing protein [Crocinitomix sp.]|nr:T9SS type A sorting domain-containing protein [Crocinitomix sp.]